MTAMVDELVDVVQLRAGQALGLAREPVDPAALAEDRAAEHRAAAPNHRIRVDPGPRPTVWGDGRRLGRVVDNLPGNAVKYSPGGGEVQIVVAIETDPGRRWAVLDAGVGIAAADLPFVFERFRRGDNAGAVARGGIGLAGARQIVEQAGGTIAVASDVGRGSSVAVRLPLAGTDGSAG